MTDTRSRSEVPSDPRQVAGRALPAVRIGLLGGLVGMLCCVGPTVLALLGVLGAGTAYAWAEDLYGGYAWWFRLAGLAVTGGLVILTLRRRQACSLAGARAARWRLLLITGMAVATYVVLYAVTTLAGQLAT
ncbi:MAG TPA: hypothetical protein VFX16_12070 [Pseudonocardiaceae bacterium]|nr:hypothetical protein [Pseudonocardiaceae bacterium]